MWRHVPPDNKIRVERRATVEKWKSIYASGRQPGGSPASPIIEEFLLKNARSGMRILDAGCGTGRSSRYLSAKLLQAGIEMDYICIDALPLLSQHSKMEMMIADAFFLPFKGNTFAFVYMRHLMDEYSLASRLAIAAEMHRLLREEGALLIEMRANEFITDIQNFCSAIENSGMFSVTLINFRRCAGSSWKSSRYSVDIIALKSM